MELRGFKLLFHFLFQNFWKQKYAALEKDSEKMVHKKQKHIVILEARIAELERENGELKKSESRLQADVEAKRLICEKLDEDLKQVNAERNNLVAECKGLKVSSCGGVFLYATVYHMFSDPA